VHDYLGVDFEVIWGIIQNEVPELKAAIQAMLAASNSDATHPATD
jgi:uncharacterized protein with HEPN domain